MYFIPAAVILLAPLALIVRVSLPYTKTVLPLILVRSQIKYMLGGETGKIRGKTKVEFRTSSKRIYFVYNILVFCEDVDFKVTCFKFMTVFITRRDAACF